MRSFPVFFPDSREIPLGEGFAPDCVIHHPVHQFLYFSENRSKFACVRAISLQPSCLTLPFRQAPFSLYYILVAAAIWLAWPAPTMTSAARSCRWSTSTRSDARAKL